MVKLLHAADLHLDSPFSGLSPALAAQRREEQRQLLEGLSALARERKVDALLLSGDLLDSGRTFRDTTQALAAQLGAAGCPVFIAPGNHDCYSPQSPYAAIPWPDNVHIFTSEQVESIPLEGKNCTIHGAAFCAPKVERSPLTGFSVPADDTVHVMALHGEVDTTSGYGPILSADIAASGLDYLALGHIHQHSGLQKAGRTHWAYPGCPEGRGFDELGEKGVLYLEVDKNTCKSEFIPLGKRRYEIVSVDLTGVSDPLVTVRAALPTDTKNHIYRILLTGERPEGLDVPGLTAALEGDFFALTLRDQTRAPRKLWERMEEDTLTGLFLREMSARCQAEPDNEMLQLAVRFGLAALEGEEDPAP